MVRTLRGTAQNSASSFKIIDENATQSGKELTKKPSIRTRTALKDLSNNVQKPTSAAAIDAKKVLKPPVPKRSELAKNPAVSNIRKEMKPTHLTIKSEKSIYEKVSDPMDVDTMDIEDEPAKKRAYPLPPVMDPFRIRPDDLEDIDELDTEDPMFCTEYVPFIYSYLREKEFSDRVNPNYFSIQTELKEVHRRILVDWLCEVALKFKLLSESVFLAIGILDRYLERNNIKKSDFQLIGSACLLIAAKFEEISTPEVQDFVFIAASAFTREDLINKEKEVLTSLDFNISFPIPLTFLRRFSKSAHSDSKIHTLSKYLIELSLIDNGMIKYLPSEIAAAAVYIARAMSEISPRWNPTIEFYSGYSEDDVRPCALALNEVLLNQTTSKYRSATTKYASNSYLNVSEIPAVEFL